jgi:hypothetical protein
MAIANSVLRRMEVDGTLDTDEAALMDALRDGGADVDGLLTRLLRARQEADKNAAAVAERVLDLNWRKARFGRQEEEYLAAAYSILDALGLTKWRSAEFSVSVTAGRPGVILTDETALPDRFVRIERKADKTAIKAALEAGEIVPGAELANGIPTMTVRTK